MDKMFHLCKLIKIYKEFISYFYIYISTVSQTVLLYRNYNRYRLIFSFFYVSIILFRDYYKESFSFFFFLIIISIKTQSCYKTE